MCAWTYLTPLGWTPPYSEHFFWVPWPFTIERLFHCTWYLCKNYIYMALSFILCLWFNIVAYFEKYRGVDLGILWSIIWSLRNIFMECLHNFFKLYTSIHRSMYIQITILSLSHLEWWSVTCAAPRTNFLYLLRSRHCIIIIILFVFKISSSTVPLRCRFILVGASSGYMFPLPEYISFRQ